MQLNLSADLPSPQALFCLRFMRHLRELFAQRRCSVARGFGLAWERAMDEVPLEDKDQPAVYWQLIDWAKRAELFPADHDGRRAA